MKEEEDELVIAAAIIARTAPEAWKRFAGAVHGLSAAQTRYCIQSAVDVLPVLQGRAQIAARLSELLASCVQMADKIEERKKK